MGSVCFSFFVAFLGLIPSKEKSAANSVFSRLDYKPSVSTQRTPITNPQHLATGAESPVGRKRIIELTKTSSGSAPRTVSSTSPVVRKISTISPIRKIVTTTSSKPVWESDEVRGTSLPSKVLAKRLVSSDNTRTVGKRLEDRITTTVLNSEQVRGHNSKPAISSTVTRRAARGSKNQVGTRRSGLFAYEGSTTDQRRGVVSVVATPSSAAVAVRSSMVADEYEYQTKRQRDIRSRLELKEREKRARRGGPLVGRLDSHKVFRRLE